MKLNEIGDLIRAFLADEIGEWDWDDFISIRVENPLIQKVKDYCNSLPLISPPTDDYSYCSNSGVKELISLADELEKGEYAVLEWLKQRNL